MKDAEMKKKTKNITPLILEIIEYSGAGMTGIGGDFIDERIYDRRGRGYVPGPSFDFKETEKIIRASRSIP